MFYDSVYTLIFNLSTKKVVIHKKCITTFDLSKNKNNKLLNKKGSLTQNNSYNIGESNREKLCLKCNQCD